MAHPNQEVLNQIRAILRAYVRFGASIMVDAEGIIPAELYLVLQQVLGLEPGEDLPKEVKDVLRAHAAALSNVEATLTPDQQAQLAKFWDNLKKAKNQRQLDVAEQAKESLDAPVQDAIDRQRRLRQSIATQLLDAWKKQNPEESESEDADDEGEDSDQHTDAQDMDEPSEDDADDGEGDGEGDDDGDGDGDGDGEGQPGKGKGQPGEGQGQPSDGDGEGQPSDGQPGKGKPSKGKGKYQEGQSAEDTEPGHEEWMKQLEKELEEQAQAEADAEKGDGDGDGDDGDDGDGKGKTDTSDPNRPDVEGVLNLSDITPDPADVLAAKQALARMIAKGLDNPTQLPRWKLGEFVKRQTTWRNLKGAKKPTLERKAVLFIIDNSPSMAHLEKQSRALAAALSASGGPGGADVIVALSSNGDYSSDQELTKTNHDGAWFLNGKLMGVLPKPSKSSGVDPRHDGYCWKWFIKKVLPRYKINVHLIGFYGDYDGTKKWNFISNELKEVQALWFNPENKQLAGVLAHKNPNLTGRGLGASYGYVQGDRRFEVFRGTMFTQVDTVQEIAAALKKVAGV